MRSGNSGKSQRATAGAPRLRRSLFRKVNKAIDRAEGLLESNSGLSGVLAYVHPIFLGRQNRYDLEIDQIGPAVDPCLKSIAILCLHHLETAGVRRINSACMINHTVEQHPAITNKAFPDRFGI